MPRRNKNASKGAYTRRKVSKPAQRKARNKVKKDVSYAEM